MCALVDNIHTRRFVFLLERKRLNDAVQYAFQHPINGSCFVISTNVPIGADVERNSDLGRYPLNSLYAVLKHSGNVSKALIRSVYRAISSTGGVTSKILQTTSSTGGTALVYRILSTMKPNVKRFADTMVRDPVFHELCTEAMLAIIIHCFHANEPFRCLPLDVANRKLFRDHIDYCIASIVSVMKSNDLDRIPFDRRRLHRDGRSRLDPYNGIDTDDDVRLPLTSESDSDTDDDLSGNTPSLSFPDNVSALTFAVQFCWPKTTVVLLERMLDFETGLFQMMQEFLSLSCSKSPLGITSIFPFGVSGDVSREMKVELYDLLRKARIRLRNHLLDFQKTLDDLTDSNWNGVCQIVTGYCFGVDTNMIVSSEFLGAKELHARSAFYERLSD